MSLSRHQSFLCALFALSLMTAGESGFAQSSAQTEEVGRLFLTPAERSHLEALRQRSLQPQVLVEEPEPEPERPAPVLEPEERLFSHGGTLRRSDGSYTIWLNSQAYAQDQLPDNVELLLPYSQGRLLIRNPDNGIGYEIKPGQVLDLNTGQILEAYQLPAATPEQSPDQQ
jgi:hypothetical protein